MQPANRLSSFCHRFYLISELIYFSTPILSLFSAVHSAWLPSSVQSWIHAIGNKGAPRIAYGRSRAYSLSAIYRTNIGFGWLPECFFGPLKGLVQYRPFLIY